jgi:hypothetical protein
MQEVLVAIIFVGALSYMGWRLYLRSQKKADCGSDCGCEPKQVSFTRGKGE